MSRLGINMQSVGGLGHRRAATVATRDIEREVML
jgi:hypothetical protein